MEKARKPHSEEQRYIHDIQLAEAMRRRASTKEIKPNTSGSSRSVASTSTSEALSLGLRGLDEADNLRDEGHIQCALDLYQSAIEVLIRLLRSEIPASYNKATLEERIRVALTDAEDCKELIRKGKVKQSACETSTESPMRKTCFTRITEYLASVRTPAASSSQKPKPQTKPAPSTIRKPMAPKQTSPSNRTLSSVNTTNTSRTIGTNISQPRIQAPSNSNSLHAKEVQGLIQNVIEDMYVPPSKLQATTWDDIAGLANAKQALQEAAIMPLVRPDLFTGLRKPQNILLYGPPGTGKTMLVKAVAHESRCSLFTCSASAITSKWLGEGEKLIRALFSVAKQYAPTILFLDEVDAILSSRKSDGEHEASRRIKTEVMVQMDGITPDSAQVLVIACTNCPWDVDSAILRRFSRRIFVPLPDKDARKALFKALLKKAGKHSLSKSEISDIVKRLKNFSGSDIVSIASEASFGPLRSVGTLEDIRSVRAKDVRPISAEDFENAINQATKSVTKEQLKKYDDWQRDQAA